MHLLDGNSDVLVRQTVLPTAISSVKAYEGYQQIKDSGLQLLLPNHMMKYEY